MANVFGILTAIVLALSAFVAFKNKAAYEKEITSTQEEKSKLVQSEARLTADKKRLAELPVEIGEIDAEVDKYTAEEAELTKANMAVKKSVDETTAKITENKEKLDDIRTKTEKTGNIGELAAKMRATSAELVELGDSISSNEAKLANLKAQDTSTQSEISKAKGVFDNYAKSQSLPTLNTRIRSIYPNWGFVTLASGNNAGVVANSTLSVVRGNETVAKLLVTGVESNSASASIVPDSIGQDVTLMVGDRVVPGAK